MGNDTIPLLMYSRPECHLCEQAAEVVAGFDPRISLVEVNIENDIALIQRYGDRVPVLARTDNAEELNWPFDATGLKAFLK